MAENEPLTWTVSTPGAKEAADNLTAMKVAADGLTASLKAAGEAARATLADLRRASRASAPRAGGGPAGGATGGSGGGATGAAGAAQDAAEGAVIRRQLTFNRGAAEAIAAGNRERARLEAERRGIIEAAGKAAASEETRVAVEAAKAVREGTALVDRAWKERQRETVAAIRQAERAEAAEARQSEQNRTRASRAFGGAVSGAGNVIGTVAGGIVGAVRTAAGLASSVVSAVVQEVEGLLAVGERVAGVLGGTLVAALVATATEGVNTEQALQRTTLALTRIEGSGAGAAAVLSQVRDAAHNSGLSLLELLGPGRELAQAYGPQGLGKVGETLKAFRDAALATGAGREGIERSLFSFRELQETPGASQAGRMLRQFDRALPGVNARKIIREQFGTADPELLTLAGVTGRQIADALVAGLRTQFGGMADALGRRDIGVALGNLRTAWELLANSIAGTLGPQIAGAISDLATGIERLGANRDFVSALAVPFRLIGDAIQFAAGHLPQFVTWLSSILTRANVVNVLSQTWGYIRAIGDELGRFLGALAGGRKASDFWDAFRNAARTALDYVGKGWQEFLLAVRFASETAPLVFGVIGNSISLVKDHVDALTQSVKDLVTEIGRIPGLGLGGKPGGAGPNGEVTPQTLSIPGPGSRAQAAAGQPIGVQFRMGNVNPGGFLNPRLPMPVRPEYVEGGSFRGKELREIAEHPERFGDANSQAAARKLGTATPPPRTGTYGPASPFVPPAQAPVPVTGPVARGDRERQLDAQIAEIQRRFAAFQAEARRIASQPFGGMGDDFTERQQRYAEEARRHMDGGGQGAGEPPPGVSGGMASGETPAQARNRERRGIVYPRSGPSGGSPPVLEMDSTGRDKARVAGGDGDTNDGSVTITPLPKSPRGRGLPRGIAPPTMIASGYAAPGAGAGAQAGGAGGEEDTDQLQLQTDIETILNRNRAIYDAGISQAKVVSDLLKDAGPFATRLQQAWAAANAAASEVQNTIPALQAEQADIEANIGRVNPATAFYSQLRQRQSELQGQINAALRESNRAQADAVRATATEARGMLDAQVQTERATEANLAELNPLAAQSRGLRNLAPLLRRRIALLGTPVPGESEEEAERRKAEQEQTRGELLKTVLQGGGFGGKAAFGRTLDGSLLSLVNTKRLGDIGQQAEEELTQAAQYAYPQMQARARMQRASALTRQFNRLLAPELRAMLKEEAEQRHAALEAIGGGVLSPEDVEEYRGKEGELRARRRAAGRFAGLAGGPLSDAADASRAGRGTLADLQASAGPFQAAPGESAEDYSARRDAQYSGGGWWRQSGPAASDGSTRPVVLNLPVAFGPEQLMAAIWEVIRGMFGEQYPGPAPMQ